MKEARQAALTALHALDKEPLGFYPTPLHRLAKLSEMTGVEIWIKREDFSGVSLFGGNKIRKLEYLLAQAKREGCDTVFTYGATQSNHAMQTAVAARRCGMTPVLWLGAIVEPKAEDIRANLLLDTILGAEIHILTSIGSTKETMAANKPLFAARIAELEAEGHKIFDVPIGGSLPRGAAGFAECWIELMQQCEDAGFTPDTVFCGTGSGGTLAGLAAGKTMSMDTGVALQAFTVGKKDLATYGAGVRDLARAVIVLTGRSYALADDAFAIGDVSGPGYEKPHKEANDDIRLLARTEGLFADSVYSGKAFHGMMDMIRSGAVKRGSRVVFLHTGGATALFSEAEIVGDLAAPSFVHH